MVTSFSVVFQNFCFAAMRSGAIPMVARFERIVHHKSEIFVVKQAIIEHLSIPWFEDAQFLHFAGHQDHWENKEGESILTRHGAQWQEPLLKMCSQASFLSGAMTQILVVSEKNPRDH